MWFTAGPEDVCDFLSMELSELLKSSVRSKVESKAPEGFAPLSTPLRFTGWLPAVRFLRFLDIFELVSGCVST